MPWKIGTRYADTQEWRTWNPPEPVPFVEEGRSEEDPPLDEADLDLLGIEYQQDTENGVHLVRFEDHTEIGGAVFLPGVWHPLQPGMRIEVEGRTFTFNPDLI